MPPQDIPLEEEELSNEKPDFLTPDIKQDTSGINTQYLASGIVTLGAFAAGCSMSWSSSAIPLVSSNYNIDPQNRSLHETWIAAILNIGAVCGAIPAGLISENFGRKFTLLSLALTLIVSWILIAVSPSTWGLYVGRFASGVTVGALSVSIPPYITDIAESKFRNEVSNFYHIQLSAGIFYGYLIGTVESISILSLLASVIPAAFFIAFIFMPESPFYLTTQGKHTEAKTSLRYFRGLDNNVDEELEAFKEDIRESFRNKGTFKNIFSTKATLKALAISFGLMIFQQLSGIYAIIFYAARIFESCGTVMPPQVGAILLGMLMVMSSSFSHSFLKNARTRSRLLLSYIMMAVGIGSAGMYMHLKVSLDEFDKTKITWIPVLSLYIYVGFYEMGAGPIPWLMLRRIFPKNITRRCTALTACVNWALAFLVTLMFPNVAETIGHGWIMFNFGICCLLAAVFVYFLVPETQGKDLKDIQNDLDGVKGRRTHRHVIEVESVSMTMD